MSTPGIRSRIAATAAGLTLAGAAAAVLALGMAAPATAAALGDYGYVAAGATYTSTTADWTVPAAHCSTANTDISIWTGLDGYSSPTVEQVGADSDCAGTTADYYGWYDVYPASPVIFSNTVKAGDDLAASVTFSGTKTFTLTLRDVTQGWTKTVQQSLAGAARSSAETFAEVPSTFTCAKALTIANFTGVTVNGASLGSQDPLLVSSGDPHIVVSPVSGSSFSVSCEP
jgi:Peptidase A4 family